MRLLVLSLNTFPYPPSHGAAEVRTFNLLRQIGPLHDITLVAHKTQNATAENIHTLKTWVKDIKLFPVPDKKDPGQDRNPLKQALRLAQFFITGTPPSVTFRFSPEVYTWVTQQVEGGDYDAVVCEHGVNEMYVHPKLRERVKTVADIHSSVYGWVLDHLEAGASENTLRDRLYLPLLARYEKRYCAKFTHLVVTTPNDRKHIQSLIPDANINIVSTGVDLETSPYRSHDPGGQSLIFIGAMDSSHNIDAACYFAQTIFPLVRQRYPEATLSLVGTRPVPAVKELDSIPGVTVTGRVPSITECLQQSTVSVVPLRAGIGIKTKTLESMAVGVPVVGSDRGLEGMAVDVEGVPLRALRANQPEDYVKAIGQLFEDAALRQTLSANARQMIEAEFNWESLGQKYAQVLSS
ncbi:glycosyltransferase [Leptolyngbyaceae cyanobacterium CCMR0082]|uniref:Glycosyltransferase n=3 Tax=Adonisia TaxID=2950183 RepID=A0A6M0S191_9CYAN|nr:glycosyltransferase family 4 protein [Adonisia turfae]MDV3347565.1 glycosyltransferase family 4 protein [Leptothoe sp. LEGE 181152]NEZ62245.1 glycosyltransferase [Adonisia turfae CCMR0082]